MLGDRRREIEVLMKKKLILIMLALVMANLMIAMGIIENTQRLHRSVRCNYLYSDSEVKVCQ